MFFLKELTFWSSSRPCVSSFSAPPSQVVPRHKTQSRPLLIQLPLFLNYRKKYTKFKNWIFRILVFLYLKKIDYLALETSRLGSPDRRGRSFRWRWNRDHQTGRHCLLSRSQSWSGYSSLDLRKHLFVFAAWFLCYYSSNKLDYCWLVRLVDCSGWLQSRSRSRPRQRSASLNYFDTFSLIFYLFLYDISK